MSETFDCRTREILKSTEITKCLIRWESLLDGFEYCMGSFSDSFFMEPRSLPDADTLSCLRIARIRIHGYLSPASDAKDLFHQIITTAEGSLTITCHIGFEEVNSKQSKRGYDAISVIRGNGYSYLGYSANGSRVSKDCAYAKQVISSIIDKLMLPIHIEMRDDQYYLSHTDEAKEVSILRGGSDYRNPTAFRCEVDWDGNTLIDKMFEILPLVATKKRFDVCWRTGKSLPYGATEDPDGSIIGFYRRLMELDLPAERYFIDIGFHIDNIEGLEALRQLCGPKDDCFVQVCTFKVSDREYGRIGVHTCHDGHRVTFECPMPVDIAWLNGTLGIEFEEY